MNARATSSKPDSKVPWLDLGHDWRENTSWSSRRQALDDKKVNTPLAEKGHSRSCTEADGGPGGRTHYRSAESCSTSSTNATLSVQGHQLSPQLVVDDEAVSAGTKRSDLYLDQNPSSLAIVSEILRQMIDL